MVIKIKVYRFIDIKVDTISFLVNSGCETNRYDTTSISAENIIIKIFVKPKNPIPENGISTAIRTVATRSANVIVLMNRTEYFSVSTGKPPFLKSSL